MRAAFFCTCFALTQFLLSAQPNPQWHLFHPPLSLGACAVLKGDIWAVAPYAGVVRMDRLSGQWQYYHSGNAPFLSNDFSDLVVDGQNRLWIAYRSGNFMVWENETWKYVASGTTEVRHLRRDYAGNLWYEGDGRVYSIENGLIRDRNADFESKLPLTAANSTGGTDAWYALGDTLKRRRGTVVTTFPLPTAWGTFLFEGTLYTLGVLTPVYVFNDGRLLVELGYQAKTVGSNGEDYWIAAHQRLLFDGQNWALPAALNPEWGKRTGFHYRTTPDNQLYVQRDSLLLALVPEGLQTAGQTNCNTPSNAFLENTTKDENGYFWASYTPIIAHAPHVTPALIRFKASECTRYPPFFNSTLTSYATHRLSTTVNGSVWAVRPNDNTYYYPGLQDISVFRKGQWARIPITPFDDAHPAKRVDILDFEVDGQDKPYVTTHFPDLYERAFWHWNGSAFEPSPYPVASFTLEPGGDALWYTAYTRVYRATAGGSPTLVCDPQNTPGMPTNGAALDQMVVDAAGNLWATVDNYFPDYGLYRRSPDGHWQKWDESNSPLRRGDFGAPSLFDDHLGHLWLLSGNGLWRFDGQNFEDKSDLFLGQRPFLEMAASADSVLWACSLDGLTKIAKDQAQSVRVLRSEKIIPAFHLAVDTADNIWLSTSIGVAVYNERGVRLPSPTTAVENPEPTLGPVVFPNPFADYLDIRFPHAGNYKIQLFDQLGRLCAMERVVNSNFLRFQTPALPKGVYFVHVEGQNQVFKIVKM